MDLYFAEFRLQGFPSCISLSVLLLLHFCFLLFISHCLLFIFSRFRSEIFEKMTELSRENERASTSQSNLGTAVHFYGF